MAINYSWDFPNIEVQYTSNSLADVVTELRWHLTGEVGGGEYFDGRVGILKVGPVAAESFVAFIKDFETISAEVTIYFTSCVSTSFHFFKLETKTASPFFPLHD